MRAAASRIQAGWTERACKTKTSPRISSKDMRCVFVKSFPRIQRNPFQFQENVSVGSRPATHVCHALTTARMEIHGKHLDLTDAMKDYITQKVEHAVEKYEGMVKKVDVKVSVHGGDAGKGAKQQKTEVTIFMKKGVLRAQAQEESLYASVDLVSDKVSRKLRKVKEKSGVKAGKHRGSAVVSEMVDSEIVQDSELPIYEDAKLPQEVVRTKYFFLDALDMDEALDQIKNIDHSFFVFRDKETNGVQVLYKRNHGGYGLIIPMDSNAQVDEEEAELYSQPL